jgi:hypothetical protein
MNVLHWQPGGSTAGRGARMWCSLEECSRKGCKNFVQPGGSAAGKGAGRCARMWCSLKGVLKDGLQECGAA